MLMAAASPDAIPSEPIPDWVQEWLTSRETRAQKKATTAKKEPDAKAAAKRLDKKLNRINIGITSLNQFIQDLTHQGLATPEIKDPETWDNMAKRMIDAQAPGLASHLRGLRHHSALKSNNSSDFPSQKKKSSPPHLSMTHGSSHLGHFSYKNSFKHPSHGSLETNLNAGPKPSNSAP